MLPIGGNMVPIGKDTHLSIVKLKIKKLKASV